jgi:hypothetical protein
MTLSAGFTASLEGKTLASTTRAKLAVVIDYFAFQDADESASLRRASAEFLP